MIGGNYWRTQKQGSAEAVPVESKGVVIVLASLSIITQLCNIYQMIRNCIFIINEIRKIWTDELTPGCIFAFMGTSYCAP